MEIVIASNNVHKLAEIREMLPDSFRLISLKAAGITVELPETGATFRDNALQKARYVYSLTGRNCLSDDSGLETDALDGAPGVYSARFAGIGATDAMNLQKLMFELKDASSRKARFKAVLALILDGKEFIFEGQVIGSIAEEPAGSGGFGYDPVFIPEGYSTTFAALPPEIKKSISHRAAAVSKLRMFLEQLKSE